MERGFGSRGMTRTREFAGREKMLRLVVVEMVLVVVEMVDKVMVMCVGWWRW